MRAALLIAGLLLASIRPGWAEPLKIVALGTSFTNGKGVASSEAYPARLEAKLRAAGLDATVLNYGVNGNSSRDIYDRISQIPRDTRIVIYEFARGNDTRRGLDEEDTFNDSDRIIARLTQDHYRVLLIIRDKNQQRLSRRVGTYMELVRKYGISYVTIAQPDDMLIQTGPARGHPTAPAHELIADAVKRALEPMLGASR